MALSPFLPAKFSLPRLPAVASRHRLIQMLEAAREASCTWICGAGGSGKTTLTADYLQRTSGRHLWFNVDEGDADPSTAIANLISLARHAFGNEVDLPFLVADHALDPARFYRLFFRMFYGNLTGGDVVVFDSCERASTDGFNLLLRIAVEEVPLGVRLLVLSRHWLPDVLLKGLADRRIAVVTAGDLRLSLPEARAVALAMHAQPGTRIENLHRLSDGWAAGLVLMLSAQGGAASASDPENLDLSSREAVFGYFAAELFESADAALREVMLRTCLLPWVDEVQAEALTSDPAAKEWLDELHRRHLFTVRRDGPKAASSCVYVYHDLFRAFLVSRLERALSADDLIELRTKVATLLESAGLPTEAVAQWRLAGRWDEVVRLIRTEAHRLVDQGQLRTLEEWLAGVPMQQLDTDPWLLYFRGQVTAGTAPVRAVALIESAHEKFQTAGDIPGQFSAAFAQMQLLAGASSNYKPWDRWIDVLGDLLTRHPPGEQALAVRAWHTFLFVCFYRRPRHPLVGRAVAILVEALRSSRLRPAQAIQAATGVIAYAHFACDTELADRALPILNRHIRDEQIGLLSRTIAATWTHVYHFFNARYQDALASCEFALRLAEEGGFTTMALALRWYRVQSRLYLGDCEAALREAGQLRLLPTGPLDAYPTAYATTSEALVHFASGDLATAIAIGEQGLEAWERNGFNLARLGWAMSMQAVYRMASGDLEAALAIVSQAEAELDGTVCNYPFSLHALLRAHAALATGMRDEAVRQMGIALAPAGNRKRLAVLRWSGPLLPVMLSLAWEHGIARDAIAALVDEWGISAPSPGTLHWPRPIVLRLLGQFEVFKAGEPLGFGRKPPRKVLSLLQAIAISGERGLGLDSVREFLWPDHDGDAAAVSQTTALHRLRKLLEMPQAVVLLEGRLYLDPAFVWIDVMAFEQLAQSDDPRDQREALGLYRGPLLPHGEDAGWCVSARLRLRDRFVRVIKRLVSTLDPEDVPGAEALYRQGVDAEPLVESNYIGLMRCSARRGAPAEVLAVFRRLKSTLAASTGQSPSVEVQQVLSECLDTAAQPPVKAVGIPPSDRRSTARPPDSQGHIGIPSRR